MCWGGVLSSDWKDARVEHDYGITFNRNNQVEKVSRMEKAFYPKANREEGSISYLLPQTESDKIRGDILMNSQVVDGTSVSGFGYVQNRPYKWKMLIESDIKSIAVVPDRFYDAHLNSYPIDVTSQLIVNSNYTYYTPSTGETDTLESGQYIIYRINHEDSKILPPIGNLIVDLATDTGDKEPTSDSTNKIESYDETYPITFDGNVGSKEWNLLEGQTTTIYIEDTTTTYGENNSPKYSYEVSSSNEDIAIVLIPEGSNEIQVTAVEEGKATINITVTDNEINEKSTITQIITVHSSIGESEDKTSFSDITDKLAIDEADLMCLFIDNNDDYHIYLGKITTKDSTDSFDGTWYLPETDILTSQFKNIDVHLKFESINALIYYLITKYENDISYIGLGSITSNDKNTAHPLYAGKDQTVDLDTTSYEAKKLEGRLWSYVNPNTMTPYPDDYWFHQGEPYYIKSLTLKPKGKNLKAQSIVVTAGQFPGMYMIVGETYIRSRDTGEDERLQLKIPLCKIKSNQTLTLEAEGDPTTFSLECEVARPENGIMMEITSYEVATRMVETEEGFIEQKDGSTEVLSE